MSLTYAIADLHGRFDLLLEGYTRIVTHAGSTGGHTIVHLGDYVDRGPDSRDILEFLMRETTLTYGWKRIVLKGNHEDIMRQACWAPSKIGWWLQNGGGRTLMSYGLKVGDVIDVSVVPAEHLDWIFHLPLMHVDEHRVFVHAGVDPHVDLKLQTQETLTWMIYPAGWPGGDYHSGRHVVHGHEQFADGPKLYSGRTNLDTFAWRTGRLVVGVFDDDKPGGPVDLIEVKGPPA